MQHLLHDVFWELLFLPLLCSPYSFSEKFRRPAGGVLCSMAHCRRQLESAGKFPTKALGLTRLPRQPVGQGEGTARRGVGERGVAEGAGLW